MIRQVHVEESSMAGVGRKILIEPPNLLHPNKCGLRLVQMRQRREIVHLSSGSALGSRGPPGF